MNELSIDETKNILGGAIPLLTTVIAVGAIGLLMITVFKIYQSHSGEVNLGPGFKFKWLLD